MRRSLLLLVTTLFAIFPALSPAQVPQTATPITTLPATIKKPGIYVIKKDLNFKLATGAAITITANNVILDLGGHVLSNSLASTATSTPTAAIGVSSSGPINVTVRNGRIVGFDDGVNLTSSDPGELVAEHLQVNDCSHTGISINGDQVEVRECRLRNIGIATAPSNVWGILITASTSYVGDNEVYNMTSNATAARGIQVISQALGIVARNRVINKAVIGGSFGIICFNNSNPNAANVANGNYVANWSTGICFASGSPGKYMDNLTVNCTTAFSGGTSVGSNN
ncbi:hypothetical protein ACXR0O_03010 [Verrucomicrobiota bacterium sgz303538]